MIYVAASLAVVVLILALGLWLTLGRMQRTARDIGYKLSETVAQAIREEKARREREINEKESAARGSVETKSNDELERELNK
jgi:predicted Holliday junction resolvase-like endonuclease